MGHFFGDLKEGLQEALGYEKNMVTLRAHSIEPLMPPVQDYAKDIKQMHNQEPEGFSTRR